MENLIIEKIKVLNKDKIVSNNFNILNKLKKLFLIIFIFKYTKYSIRILKLFFNLDFLKRNQKNISTIL